MTIFFDLVFKFISFNEKTILWVNVKFGFRQVNTYDRSKCVLIFIRTVVFIADIVVSLHTVKFMIVIFLKLSAMVTGLLLKQVLMVLVEILGFCLYGRVEITCVVLLPIQKEFSVVQERHDQYLLGAIVFRIDDQVCQFLTLPWWHGAICGYLLTTFLEKYVLIFIKILFVSIRWWFWFIDEIIPYFNDWVSEIYVAILKSVNIWLEFAYKMFTR